MRAIERVTEHIRSHRCYGHPVFHHWAAVEPAPEVVGALFHQIQSFCASTRPGHNLPDALGELGLDHESHLLAEIVESEENHGPELATMAGHIVNRAAGRQVCANLADQQAVEATLKEYSDRLLGNLPGYDAQSGLTVQCRKAISVFERRKLTDRASTFKNLGTALALEMISNRHLIPGEMHALVESGIYRTSLNEPEMHYLLEHFGETGAEHQHEINAFTAVEHVLTPETEKLVLEGANEFLDSLAGMWDVLDATLLHSGFPADTKATLDVPISAAR